MGVENKYKVKDEALFAEVQKLKDGTSGDYNLLYELSEKYIYKIINDIVKNHHTTEDLMQETYLQIYNKIGTLQEAKTFYVWAGRIATNLTLRHVQKYRKETLAVADEEGSTDFVFDVATDDNECFIPENVLMDKEKQRLIAEIIDNLSIEQKLSIQYFYYEEMSVKDIARVMDCSEGTVKSRLNYARKSIKDAVIDLDVKQGTRLYSLGTLPLFWLVFREGVEALVLAGTAGATAAVGVAGNVAGAVGGTSSVGTAGAVAGSAGSAGATASTGASAGAGSVASTGTTAGSATSAGATTVGTAASTGAAGGTVTGAAGTVGTAGGVSAAGSAASTGVAVGSAASTGATKVASGLFTKFFSTVAFKIIAAIVIAGVVIGGGVVVANQRKDPKPADTPEVGESSTANTESTENIESADVIVNEDSNNTESDSSDILPQGVTTDGVKNTLKISYDCKYDAYNREYWETSSLGAYLQIGEYTAGMGSYVISNYGFPTEKILSGGIQQFLDEQIPEEEIRAFFDEYQYICAENKESIYETDVTEDFPETFEFDIDGVHFTAKIESVKKRLYMVPADEVRTIYTASYHDESRMQDSCASGVIYHITATYSCDKDIMTVKYARDAKGTYLFGEPQEESTVVNGIRIVQTYRCGARTDLDIYFLEGGIILYQDGEQMDSASFVSPIATMGEIPVEARVPDGIYEFFSANISEEEILEFFDTFQYTAVQRGGYWDDISARMPKTMEFDFDGKHYVVEIKDLHMHIGILTGYARGVTFEVEGTYTCYSID